jgi:hypothetical protein
MEVDTVPTREKKETRYASWFRKVKKKKSKGNKNDFLMFAYLRQ